ncbi:MAG: GDP-mannose 4,6-dehydratase [Legionellaceae bacterium]|nr:GDP-mannose 4,6-dehydratase [Legionellaceae bacterium]
MNVLITGGAGFIGSHLVEYHLAKHDEVYAIDDCSTGTELNLTPFKNNPHFHFIKADILLYPELEKIVSWADRIYHMAAVVGVLKVINDSERLLAINIVGTERLLRAAKLSKRKPRILLASSSEVYGDGHGHPLQEDSNLIIGGGRKSCSTYVVSKIAVEYFGLSYYQHFGLRITSLRIFNTIGPRQLGGYGMVVPRFITEAINHQPIVVYGTGEQTRSFCDVRDVTVMFDKIANNDKTIGEILNVGQDQEISINDLAKLVKKIAGTTSEIQHIPYDQVYGNGFEDFMFRRPDTTKLQYFIEHQYEWDLKKSLTHLIARQTK